MSTLPLSKRARTGGNPIPSQSGAKPSKSHSKPTASALPPVTKEDIATLSLAECQRLIFGLCSGPTAAPVISAYIARVKEAKAKAIAEAVPDFGRPVDRLSSTLDEVEEYEEDEWSYDRQNDAQERAWEAVCEGTQKMLAECAKSSVAAARTEALEALTEMADCIRRSVRAEQMAADGWANTLVDTMEKIFEMQKARGESRAFINTSAEFRYVVGDYERLGTSVFRDLRDKIFREDGI